MLGLSNPARPNFIALSNQIYIYSYTCTILIIINLVIGQWKCMVSHMTSKFLKSYLLLIDCWNYFKISGMDLGFMISLCAIYDQSRGTRVSLSIFFFRLSENAFKSLRECEIICFVLELLKSATYFNNSR